MDCTDIADKDVGYAVGCLLQNLNINPRYFPLFFKDFVELPNGDRDVPGKDYYEIKDDSGLVVWRWRKTKPLIKPEDVL